MLYCYLQAHGPTFVATSPPAPFCKVEVLGWCVMKWVSFVSAIGWDCVCGVVLGMSLGSWCHLWWWRWFYTTPAPIPYKRGLALNPNLTYTSLSTQAILLLLVNVFIDDFQSPPKNWKFHPSPLWAHLSYVSFNPHNLCLLIPKHVTKYYNYTMGAQSSYD